MATVSSRWSRSINGDRATARGYTLVELSVVVVIVAVLATIGVYGVRKYINAAKTSEAIEMIGSIKQAQESYRAETFAYLDVSASLSAYFPMPTGTLPGKVKYGWGNPSHPDQARWSELGIGSDAPVQFGYVTKAGGAADAVPQPGNLTQNMNWPNPPGQAWYLVKAVGDLNGDGILSVFVSSSFTNEIYSERDDD